MKNDNALLEFIFEEQQKGFEEGLVMLCPRCMVNELNKEEVMNPTSRLNGDVCICDDCGNDEAFGDEGIFPKITAEEWAIFNK